MTVFQAYLLGQINTIIAVSWVFFIFSLIKFIGLDQTGGERPKKSWWVCLVLTVVFIVVSAFTPSAATIESMYSSQMMESKNEDR